MSILIPDISGTVSTVAVTVDDKYVLVIEENKALWVMKDYRNDRLPDKLMTIFSGRDRIQSAVDVFNEYKKQQIQTQGNKS